MEIEAIGWDIGGAHLKAALVTRDGTVEQVIQTPCPLWKGVSFLHEAMKEIVGQLQIERVLHGITMTGELVDLFQTGNRA